MSRFSITLLSIHASLPQRMVVSGTVADLPMLVKKLELPNGALFFSDAVEVYITP